MAQWHEARERSYRRSLAREVCDLALRRPEVMWSRVYNALLADMRAENQAWAFVYLHPHGIEDNDF